MKKLKWYLKQLLPFSYRSKYSGEGKNYFCVWNMWFGRIYNVETYEIVNKKIKISKDRQNPK